MRKLLGVRALMLLTLLVSIGAAGSAGASALAASNPCTAKAATPRSNHFGGIIRAVPVDLACVNSDNAPNGDPPLIWHNGPVMGTTSTGPVVVTPIFWHPAGHPMASGVREPDLEVPRRRRA